MRDKNACAYMKRQVHRTAPFVTQLPQKVRITHPFHPLYDKEYGLLGYRRSWRNECVDLHDENDQVIAVPIRWTDAAPPDPFVVVAGGRSYFRTEDLVRLVNLIDGLKGHPGGVK
ncbi:MAG: Y4bD/Y4pK family protein [Methanosarcinaceae archaeon]|nr:Y4bD/Y4pK family protein [Methanosarcinaceae archaeon]